MTALFRLEAFCWDDGVHSGSGSGNVLAAAVLSGLRRSRTPKKPDSRASSDVMSGKLMDSIESISLAPSRMA